MAWGWGWWGAPQQDRLIEPAVEADIKSSEDGVASSAWGWGTASGDSKGLAVDKCDKS